MHLLLMGGSGELGGAERVLLDVVASVRHAQPAWRLTVLAPAEGPLLDAAARAGAVADLLPLDPALARIGEPAADGLVDGRGGLLGRLTRAAGPLAEYRRRLRARLRADAPDIIHTHGLKAHLLAAWSNPGPAAVVWHLHDYVGPRRASAALLRRSLGRCAAIVANSASVAGDAAATLGRRVPIVPVLNAVDLQRFSPEGPRADLDAASPRVEPAPTANGPVVRVGLVATFGRWKGHLTFLEACARLPRHTAIRFYVVGAPLYRTDNSQFTLAELQARTEALGLAGRVTFTGFLPASDAALRALDIVVHASTEPEPFGLVIAEAMACGRAVVAADAGGAREIVSPGVDALVHVPGDAASLAAQIGTLAADPELRARLGRAARRTAETRFDRARLASDLLPIYERAAGATRPAPAPVPAAAVEAPGA